jgi:hypothetical protein
MQAGIAVINSRMRTTKSPTVPLRKTSITDLPPELLSVIFQFVHDSTSPIQLEKDIIPTWMRMDGPEGFEQSVAALVQPSIPEDPNLKSPTLFPYSLAAVCSFWRDALCSHPEFWTLIVLFADSKPTPLVDASLFLEWSRKHQIDVFITRRDELYPAFYSDRHEKCQINALLHILKPHLHRCRSLHVDADLSSSLPIIRKTFNGVVAPHLKFMELICDVHADDENGDDPNGDLEDEFEPELRRLVIDGKNFCQPSDELNYWMDMHGGLNQLTIAQYTPGENNHYNLQDFLDTLDSMDSSLEQVKFKGLHFPIFPYHDFLCLSSSFVHFEDVSEPFIADIYKFVYFEPLSVLRITRCPLPDLHYFQDPPETLVLEDISPNVDLLGAVTDWAGENLWLDRCHSFSGVFLKALGRRRSRIGYPCNEMRRLLLYRLPNFSISLLKKMVEKRNTRDVDYDNPDWKTATDFGPAISHLAVVQCGLRKLSAQDENWFRAHLVEFYWSSCFFLFSYLCHLSHEIQSLEMLKSSLQVAASTISLRPRCSSGLR